MSELFTIVLTSCVTVIFGVFVFVFERYFLFMYIEPIREQKKLIGEMVSTMFYFDNFFSDPGLSRTEKRNEASNELRKYSNLILSKTSLIPKYGFFSFFHLVKPKKDILKICKNLNGLSNGIFVEKEKTNDNKFIHNRALYLLNLQEEIENILNIEHV